eukprot:TRINITY_DN3113_c0_g1_i2.p1 TRINITY_DN3113_c0_g1~~TRINITY_DN3113_c0_g1_i2.p1  ORF type:complete len:202 (+),score=58.30 TRINITY_DN3113_c0_g1_i2:33-638(+)
MRVIVFFAILLLANCWEDKTEVLYHQLNNTVQRAADTAESLKKGEFKKAFENSGATIKAIEVFVQGLRDVLPAVMQQYDDFGYDTKPCWNRFLSIFAESKNLVAEIKNRNLKGAFDADRRIISALGETKKNCEAFIKKTQVEVAESMKKNPICKQTTEAAMKEIVGSMNIKGIQKLRLEGNWHMWRPVSYTHLTLPTIYSV